MWAWQGPERMAKNLFNMAGTHAHLPPTFQPVSDPQPSNAFNTGKITIVRLHA